MGRPIDHLNAGLIRKKRSILQENQVVTCEIDEGLNAKRRNGRERSGMIPFF